MRIHISNSKEYTRIFHKRTKLYNFVYSINSLFFVSVFVYKKKNKFPLVRVGNYQMPTGLLYKLHKQPGNSLYFAFLDRTSTFAPSFSRTLVACDRFLHRMI